MSKHYNPEPPSGLPTVQAPLPPSTPLTPLGLKIEEAIKHAARLGEDSAFDAVYGRGLYYARLHIQEALRPGMVDAREMSLQEFIHTLPETHRARREYIELLRSCGEV